MENKLVIYKITNLINNKVYIGQTINYKERLRHHKQTAFRESDKNRDKPLYRAIRKYGLENFKFEIIDDTAKTQEELNQKEIYYIELYDCIIDTGKGYNLETGGGNGHKSEYTKRKIAEAQMGELNHMYGKTGKLNPTSKPIMNVTTGVAYENITDCAIKEFNNIKCVKQLSRVVDPKSNRFTYKGCVYRRLDEDGNIIEKEYVQQNESFNKVMVIDLISNRIFSSISECAKYFNISDSMVRDRIYGRTKIDKYKHLFDLHIYKPNQ